MKLLAGGFTLLVIAIGSFYLLYNVLRIDAKMRTWPTTQATILSSFLEQVQSGDTNGTIRGATTSPAWNVKVTYSYQVDGITYDGNQVSNDPPGQVAWDMDTPPKKELVAVRNRFPVGSVTETYYNPERPKESFLYYRRPGEIYLTAGLGILFLLVGIALMVAGLHHLQRSSSLGERFSVKP